MATDLEWMRAARLYLRSHPCEPNDAHPAMAGHELVRLIERAEHAFAARQAEIFGSDDEGTAFADLPDEG